MEHDVFQNVEKQSGVGGGSMRIAAPPFLPALHRLCLFDARLRAGRVLPLRLFVLRQNTALSRGWWLVHAFDL